MDAPLQLNKPITLGKGDTKRAFCSLWVYLLTFRTLRFTMSDCEATKLWNYLSMHKHISGQLYATYLFQKKC